MMKFKNYMKIDATDKANESAAEKIVRNVNREAEDGLKHAKKIHSHVKHH